MWSAAETPAQPQPGVEGLVISRTAPCLLPELQHVCDLPSPLLLYISICSLSHDYPAEHAVSSPAGRGPVLFSWRRPAAFSRATCAAIGLAVQQILWLSYLPDLWQMLHGMRGCEGKLREAGGACRLQRCR